MLVIDRFEGDFAVVETGKGMVNIPKSDVPSGAKEGDVLNLIQDAKASSCRKESIQNKMNRLFKD